ncbi:MAG: hypothetical protein KDD67_02330 [Ignavibacteriae bacterium]|nr:hypothetical protein [Ignavibacteriota bacterium]MCB9216876.1 hypothetical protein [Ignavibacteria bacterium]
MNEQAITNLATPSGRIALQQYWQDLTVEQRNLVLPSLIHIWKTIVRGKGFTVSTSGTSYNIGHPLGIRLGTRVFMEEIVVRHYFNNVQALVYLGAVVLLVFLALRFAGLLSESVALIGIGIEALMLLLLFIVLFYTPDEESQATAEAIEASTREKSESSGDEVTVIREVLDELEDIGGTYATLGARLEQITRQQQESLQELNERVARIQGLEQLEYHSAKLERTNDLLDRLVGSMERLNERVDLLIGKDLEFHVRKELERHISGSLSESLADRMSLQNDSSRQSLDD